MLGKNAEAVSGWSQYNGGLLIRLGPNLIGFRAIISPPEDYK